MSTAQAWLALSQTQRRFAWDYRRQALIAQSQGKQKRYEEYRAKSDRLWREAKFNLWMAQTWPVATAEQEIRRAA